MLVNAAMLIERAAWFGANPDEKSDDRKGRTQVPSVSLRWEVAADIRSAFSSPGLADIRLRLEEIVAKYPEKAAKPAERMET